MRIFPVLLSAAYGTVAFLLLLYSYTQVDLSLTLSRASVIQTIQKGFQYIGFYNRPVSASLFVLLIFTLFFLYFTSLWGVRKKLINVKAIYILSGIVSGILLFSYTAALSYDVFNYIFTAKTVLIYQKNPYVLKPIELQGIDSMLSFMRWTHLPTAYTPVWIAMTLPFYLVSFGSLLFSLWSMKLLIIIFYFLAMVSVAILLEKKEEKVLGMAMFALHPLILIEVLVSAHNDMVMIALGLVSLVFLSMRQYTLAFFLYAFSVSVKLMTVFLLPVFAIGKNRTAVCVCMGAALLLVLSRREFLPWYLLWIIPFATLLPQNTALHRILACVSFGLLLTYAPVLYFGGYNPPVAQLKNMILIGSFVIGILSTMFPKTRGF